MAIRVMTSGESHGKAVIGTVDGLPAGVPIDLARVNTQLKLRQGGYGRGGRMKIEHDEMEILSGVRFGRTLGSPVTFVVWNRDYKNWDKRMAPFGKQPDYYEPITMPRPGHADLVGSLKYAHDDIRNVIERSSARETTARVGAGAICQELLNCFGVRSLSHIVSLGGVRTPRIDWTGRRAPGGFDANVADSPVRCSSPAATKRMIRAIDAARTRGDTLGGEFEVVFFNLPPGLGSFAQYDRKIDGRLALAIMSIHAIKGVEIGFGFEGSNRPGSEFHDEIFYSKARGYFHKTNRAGGTEGGMTTGEPLVIRGAMKPISTLLKPLRSVDIRTHRRKKSRYERSDVCALPAAGIVGEAVCAAVLADALLEKFGGDHVNDTLQAHRAYLKRIK